MGLLLKTPHQRQAWAVDSAPTGSHFLRIRDKTTKKERERKTYSRSYTELYNKSFARDSLRGRIGNPSNCTRVYGVLPPDITGQPRVIP